MNDEPNFLLEGPPPASGTQAATQSSSVPQKPQSWIRGHFIPAILEIAKLVAALGILSGAVIWAPSNIPPLENFVRDHFDSLIAEAINREIAKDNKDDKSSFDLKTKITNLIIAELNETSGEIPQKIQKQANDLFVDKLKHKIGPMVAGRFTLDSTKPYWNVDVFWNNDHSTRPWVYVEKFEKGECILIQPPDNLGYSITTPCPYHDIDIAKLLTVEPGSLPPSGLPANLFKLNKGLLDDVHKLTFILGTKDSTGKNCKSPRDSNSGPVEVEYLMATAPLVGDEEMNPK